MYSGTWCFPSLVSPVSYIFLFILGVAFSLLFITHRVYRMYLVVIKAQKLLLSRGITSQAKGSYVKLVKNMCIFLITVMSSEVPGMIVAFYVWTTTEFPPPVLDLLMLSFGLFGPFVFNPIMCYYLNYEIQIAFTKKYNSIIKSVQLIFENDRFKKVVVLYRRHSRVDTNNSVQIDIFTIKDWKYWLLDENLSKILFEYGNKNCSNENFLFYQEVLKVHELCNELLVFTKPAIETLNNNSSGVASKGSLLKNATSFVTNDMNGLKNHFLSLNSKANSKANSKSKRRKL